MTVSDAPSTRSSKELFVNITLVLHATLSICRRWVKNIFTLVKVTCSVIAARANVNITVFFLGKCIVLAFFCERECFLKKFRLFSGISLFYTLKESKLKRRLKACGLHGATNMAHSLSNWYPTLTFMTLLRVVHFTLGLFMSHVGVDDTSCCDVIWWSLAAILRMLTAAL